MGELGPKGRADALAAMRERELDVLIVGGGIVGAGTALDAATRGLSTGIVEARDWASGTSSRSSKLVHGGIRYLEQLDFALVREALVERGLLLQRIAPHLVKPVKFLYPVTVPLVERAYIGAGMALYDLFSWTGGREPGVPHHRHLTKRQLAKAAPDLDPDAFRGGMVYFDAQVDDARFVLSLVRTAAEYGAHAANRVEVVGLLRDGARVTGVEALDRESGERFEIRARQVVSATGVWTDDLQQMAGVRPFRVRASKGVHLVVPRDRIRGTLGLLLRTEKSVLFLIPWGRHWLIGTTDTDWELDLAHPAATAADIDYLLDHINKVLATPLTRDDVEGVFAGLRPLLAGESDETSKLSREHIVATPLPGFVAVAGGKLTTYRVMAKDTVDAVARGLERPTPPSVTEDIGLTGAEGYPAAWNRRGRIARKHRLTPGTVGHLLNRYGTHAREVLALVDERPELGAHLPGTEEYLAAEVVYATRHEGALHVDDVLVRRTRMSIEAWDRGVSAAPVVARLVGEVLGWDAARIALETSRYLERVEAERASQLEPDDESADRVRLAAREH